MQADSTPTSMKNSIYLYMFIVWVSKGVRLHNFAVLEFLFRVYVKEFQMPVINRLNNSCCQGNGIFENVFIVYLQRSTRKIDRYLLTNTS